MLPSTESQMREFMSARRLLVVGTSLGIGGWTPPVPKRLLEFFVVLQLGNCMTAKRYGYCELEYVDGIRDCYENPRRAQDLCAPVLVCLLIYWSWVCKRTLQ